MTTSKPPAPSVSDACPESKMDDGSHSTDLEDGGSCAWCGASAPARWLATESAAALKHDTPRPLVCVSCDHPVERCFDDDYQHSTLEADLACTGPVLPARAAGKAGE